MNRVHSLGIISGAGGRRGGMLEEATGRRRGSPVTPAARTLLRDAGLDVMPIVIGASR